MSINVEQFFDAINKISEKNVNASKKDLTVDAEIASVVNVDNGQYKVTYQGNSFDAYSTDPLIVYKKGEQVYVLVPRGDFSAKKTILGRSAYENNNSYVERQQMTNFYIDRSPNWLTDWYKLDHTPLQICAVPGSNRFSLDFRDGDGAHWADYGFMRALPTGDEIDPVTRYPVNVMSDKELDEGDEQLRIYNSTYSTIKIQASFRTDFNMGHSQGQYGLKVECLVDNPLYIEDVDDPDFAGDKDLYIRLQEEYAEFQAAIDWTRYEQDEEYKNTTNRQLEIYRSRIEQATEQPKYRTVVFDLGFSSFSGNPYQYTANIPQKGYFDVELNSLKGLSRIWLYQDGNFLCDMVPTYTENGQLVWSAENNITNRNNIFVEDIQICFAERINLLDTLYYAWIETPLGDNVYKANAAKGRPTGKNYVELVPHLWYGYEDILSPETCTVMWFREKADVTATTPTEDDRDEHNKTWVDYSGPGWMPIQKFIDGGLGKYEFADDGITLRVYRDDVDWKWDYKVVIIYHTTENNEYKENAIVEATQEVTRIDSQYDLELEQFSSQDQKEQMLRILDLNKNVHSIDSNTGEPYREWFGTWWLGLQDGSYTQISDPYLLGPLSINQYLMTSVATFRVQCYDPYEVDPDNTGVAMYQAEEVGNLELTIVTSDEGDLTIQWIGFTQYGYDANGTVKHWVGTQEQTLEVEINWAKGKATSYRLELLAPDGHKLGDRSSYEETDATGAGKTYDVPTSMMTEMWADTYNAVFHYKVRTKYDRNLTDNTFTVRIITVEGNTYEYTCPIRFSKDGDQGTQGSDWEAPIYPCNWKYGEGIGEGSFIDQIQYNSVPLVVNVRIDENGQTHYEQDNTRRVFLRPFVSKNGALIPGPKYDPFEGYYYKVYWDVRFPSNAANEKAKYASYLRIHHTNGVEIDKAGAPYSSTATQDVEESFYEAGGYPYDDSVNKLEEDPDGLRGFSIYPSSNYTDPATNKQLDENYGAVEIRFFDNLNGGTHATLEEMMYRFVVKAQIDIFKGQYDYVNQKVITDGSAELVASINSFYPIDVFLNYGNMGDFDEKKIATNWPQYVVYNPTGYQPAAFQDPLYFKYSSMLAESDTIYAARNYTPLTQTVEEKAPPGETTKRQYYKPKAHLNFQEGFHGVLATRVEDGPFFGGMFIRNQIMYLDQYGNADINAWDGQGIDMDEENGTIFAATVGAGYKIPNTNLFTGVLMGIDKAQKKDDVGGFAYGANEEILKMRQYMTGIYGYQDGISTFGIMENGTMFLGSAYGGGRIIMDGRNGTIYGGGNGIMDSDNALDAPMWNTMRLSLVDLTHSTSSYEERVIGYWEPDEKDGQQNVYTGVKGPVIKDEEGNEIQTYIKQGFNGKYFASVGGPGGEAINRNTFPYFYRYIWEHAYIKKDGYLPYYMQDNKVEYDNLPGYFDDAELTDEQRSSYESDPDNNNGIIPGAGMKIDYFMDEEKLLVKQDENEQAKRLSGFGPSRASTTPAIEIGQHVHGLMPGLLDWGEFDDVFKQLNIPGDRNFMVTYDGTLWAMNGIFMGVVIGSNIVGGRIQGSEIGIGNRLDQYEDIYVISPEYGINRCDWADLKSPVDEKVRLEDILETPDVAFYVDRTGSVVAREIKIYGGRIDMGRFHILGAEDSTADRDEYGHLIQFGESDFVGPTHFYGNVGIGPNLRRDPNLPSYQNEGSNKGNLFQTRGYVGLGIGLLDGDDTSMHAWAMGSEDNGNSMEGPFEQYDANVEEAGETGIGENRTLEQLAFFGMDTGVDYLPTRRHPNSKFQGHFWPLHFHYGWANLTAAGGGQGTSDIINSYITIMDIFQSKSFSVNTGVGSDDYLTGSNYFRAGPYGVEGMLFWIKKRWQSQNTSHKPERTADAGKDEDLYLGSFGLIDRAGGGSSTQAAIGITSWYAAPIIVSSDGESAWNTRGHFHFFIRGMGKGSGTVQNGIANSTWEHLNGTNNGLDYGIVFDMGVNCSGTDLEDNEATWGGNKVVFRTAKGPIGIGQEKNGGGIKGTWSVPGPSDPEIQGFIYIDPENSGKRAHEGGIFMGTRKGNVHIYRLGTSGVCTGPHVPELYLEEKKAMLSAPTETYIGANWTNGHTPLNCIKMTTKEISFEGSYATPENQKNIFARFG